MQTATQAKPARGQPQPNTGGRASSVSQHERKSSMASDAKSQGEIGEDGDGGHNPELGLAEEKQNG